MTLTPEAVDEIAGALHTISRSAHDQRSRNEFVPLKLFAHQDAVSGDDHSRDGVVSVSAQGMVFWRRVDYDFGHWVAERAPLDGLASFMTEVIWPRVAGEWNENWLMAEDTWSVQERAAIDAWESGKARLRSLIHRDHLKHMKSYPQLREFYLAVHSRDAASLRRYTGKRPQPVEDIGVDHIQTLVQALEDDNRDLALSQQSYLEFRTAFIGFIRGIDFNAGSVEQSACLKEVSEQLTAVRHAARQRYTKQFRAFCTSPDMLTVQKRYFSGMPEGDGTAYCALISAFVNARQDEISSP